MTGREAALAHNACRPGEHLHTALLAVVGGRVGDYFWRGSADMWQPRCGLFRPGLSISGSFFGANCSVRLAGPPDCDRPVVQRAGLRMHTLGKPQDPGKEARRWVLARHLTSTKASSRSRA